MWKTIVLLGFTLITETPAPRQKLFHSSMPWGCRSLTPEKGKIGGIKLKTQFRRWAGESRQREKSWASFPFLLPPP